MVKVGSATSFDDPQDAGRERHPNKRRDYGNRVRVDEVGMRVGRKDEASTVVKLNLHKRLHPVRGNCNLACLVRCRFRTMGRRGPSQI